MAIGGIIAGVTILAVLPATCLYARFAAKRVRSSPWMLDDTPLILALVFLYLSMTAVAISLKVGHLGQHMRTATRTELQKTFFIAWLFPNLMALELVLTRCAVSIFFLRTLYTKLTPWLRYAAYLCIVLSTASAVATIVGMLVQLIYCHGFRHDWVTPLWMSIDCFNTRASLLSIFAIGIVVDIITWTTPHHIVWGLQLRRAHKIAITAIFAIGATTIIIGIIRVANIAKFAPSGDLTYSLGTQLLLNLIQMSIGIVVACLPYMRPFFERIVPRRFTLIGGRGQVCESSFSDSERLPRQDSISVTTTIEVSETMPFAIWSNPYMASRKDSNSEKRGVSTADRLSGCLNKLSYPAVHSGQDNSFSHHYSVQHFAT